jgi:DNA-binding response OmpR family regulator/predicted regulator of Ras-like GTPase activity (Roadblock/LC7/MglB family)
MSEQWRVLVVEDDEHLNQSIVNTLSFEGYAVKGSASGPAAIRLLWAEEFDVIIGDLRTPGADGLELLQWLRAYRPNSRLIVVAPASGSPTARAQALEGGAVSYLEKPLQVHVLKEELRRLLQQTGFSANLDSFDLLDVIQMITMSRRSIALLVNTGLEERGVLYFQDGELIWAEYGVLRGEEAFFALAAHKNGTVIQQPWDDRISPNVTQPLARLIFQALQYRTKYASLQQSTGQHQPVSRIPTTTAQSLAESEIDDSPFQVLTEHQPQPQLDPVTPSHFDEIAQQNLKEWWEQTGKFAANGTSNGNGQRPGKHTIDTPRDASLHGRISENSPGSNPDAGISFPAAQSMEGSPHTDLPSWVTEQPSKSDMTMLRPSSLSNTAQTSAFPPAKSAPSPAEWQPPTPIPPTPVHRTTDPLPRNRISGRHNTVSNSAEIGARTEPRFEKRNYATLVAALQTVGYSITGFIAAAVASLEGQPIAQVAINDLDIAPMCKHFSQILHSALASFQGQRWQAYEHIIVSSADRHMLLRPLSSGGEQGAFLVLITTHDSKPDESFEILAHVEGAIVAALS